MHDALFCMLDREIVNISACQPAAGGRAFPVRESYAFCVASTGGNAHRIEEVGHAESTTFFQT